MTSKQNLDELKKYYKHLKKYIIIKQKFLQNEGNKN